MAKILGAGAALLWALCIFLRSLASSAPLLPGGRPALRPIGREYRALTRIGPRVVAVRLQLVIA